MSGDLPVIVLGGGVAGISAAVNLAQAGVRVMLLEQRKLLGGRAGSFSHSIGPHGLLDNSQHVLLGCCTALQRLYEQLGVAHLIRFDDAIRFADVHGNRARIKASFLPSPMHLGLSLASFGLLKAEQKLQIVRAMMRMLLDGKPARDASADISFQAYLQSAGQSPATIHDFWDVICISALNEPCCDASAKYGLQVFQEAFLGGRSGYRLGYASVPLSMLYTRLAGVEVRTSTQARELIVEGNAIRGVRLVSGEEIRAGHVILAAGGPASLALLEPVLHLDPRLNAIGNLQYRPILGAHLLYDRPVAIPNPIALVGASLQWVFVDPDRPELIHGVVSAADLLPDGADLVHLFDGELHRAFAEMADARLVDSVIVKEMRATFRPLPGDDAHRPTQATRIAGLTLAGDYTRTDWPATMEGAARSGQLAAEVVLDALRGRQ